jgi:hypothetical protein
MAWAAYTVQACIRQEVPEGPFRASLVVLDNHREDKRRRNRERQPAPLSLPHRREAALEQEQAVACAESAVEDAVVEGTFACIACRCRAITPQLEKPRRLCYF